MLVVGAIIVLTVILTNSNVTFVRPTLTVTKESHVVSAIYSSVKIVRSNVQNAIILGVKIVASILIAQNVLKNSALTV